MYQMITHHVHNGNNYFVYKYLLKMLVKNYYINNTLTLMIKATTNISSLR